MKRATIFLFCVLFSVNILASQEEKKDTVFIPPYPLTTHAAYQGGEQLVFSLNYGFVTGGKATLSVNDSVINNIATHHIVGKGVTVGVADVLYKIRDRYESFIDIKTNEPIKAIRSIREGRYRYYNEVEYNRDSSQVISKKSGVHKVQEGILDILSAFYFARNHKFNEELEVGEVIEFMTYFSDENFPLRIRYRGTEVIKTNFGKIECYKFSPVTEVGRAFKTEDDMQVWISRDSNRIPVRVRFDLAVGSFTCNLESFKGLKHPFSSVRH
ncbi:DUF3108 domain-containing protein [Carboxylicivirga sediminis]|uniref:DUF3108 domain-containing protein n=1 Tax=Carboxylicivirga sediminis TaxID=2006564 RepID=A0A941F7F3_9BACT|nr:DUF3108 domain-containing protein [Carboxylicivirga sediminis]MBR8537864.1 DUF3108 domain-containing protein [Carboxylicivirga sediminis]